MKKLVFLLAFLLTATTLSAQGLLGSLLGMDEKPQGPKVKFVSGDPEAKEEILMVKLHGVIMERDEEDSSVMSLRQKKNIVDVIKDNLKLAANRDAVKAVYLEINSPGGEVTASDVIYHYLKVFSEETKKPVFAHITSTGASGAYYAACGCTKIYAMPTSMIGSIGVLLQSMNIEELANKIGIKPVTIKSDKTPMKDLLSPFRQATEEEKAMLLELVEDSYQRFVEIVSENRKLSKEDVIKLANGSIYTANKSLKLGLIDGIGYREDVVAEACKILELKSLAVVKIKDEKSPFSELLGAFSEKSSDIRPVVETFMEQLTIGNTPIMMFK